MNWLNCNKHKRMTIFVLLILANSFYTISFCLGEIINPYYANTEGQYGYVKENSIFSKVPGLRYSAEREKRTLNVLMKSRAYDESLLKKQTVTYRFSFGGPTLDQDITNFYSFFAKHYPPALKPIVPRWDIAIEDCLELPSACGTLSQIIFHYGLLARYFPEDFVAKVIDPLKKKYGKVVIPGLLVVPHEYPVRLYWENDDKNKEIYKGQKINSLCKIYRFDLNIDCIKKEQGGFVYLNGQGLFTDVDLPIENAEELMTKYEQEVTSISEGYKLGFNTFYPTRIGNLKPQQDNLTMNPSISSEGSSNSFLNYGQIENLKIKKECSEGFSDEDSKLNDLKVRMQSYINNVFPDPTSQSKSSKIHPLVFFIDKFPGPPGPVPLAEFWKTKSHPEFNVETPHRELKEFTTCIKKEKVPDHIHGITLIDFFAARENNFGIIGLFPNFDKGKLLPINVTGLADLKEWLEAIPSIPSNLSDSGMPIIVNLSIDDSLDDGRHGVQNFRDTLRRIIRDSHTNVFYVIASGQPETTGAGVPLEKNCSYLPACLGELSNVLTIAGLETIRSGEMPKIWKRSNRGGEIVSIAAPGENILSTRVFFKGDLKRESLTDLTLEKLQYNLYDGTSLAAIFGTATVAHLLTNFGRIPPDNIKLHILSRAGVIADDGNSRTIFAGPKGVVAAGTLQGSVTLNTYGVDAIKIKNKPLMYGNIRSNVAEVIYFKDPLGVVEVKCPIFKIFRIHKNSKNNYSLFCYGPTPKTEWNDGEAPIYWPNVFLEPDSNMNTTKMGMPCLRRGERGECFFFQETNGNYNDWIDLREIEEIYFKVT
ncbi:MAG: S8 family serine peptidase [Nitrospirales bacterium]